jgi:hypothetical protein
MRRFSEDSAQKITLRGTDSSVYEEYFWAAEYCYLVFFLIRHVDGLPAFG